MAGPVLGLHHVTATVDLAQADLDFCAGALGLRLVKKTVNFDNHHVYHFYYGDERGTPGTIWTTFPYHGHGVRAGRHGAGQITATAFSVPAETLPAWTSRLATRGFVPRAAPPRFGASVVTVTDPAGLVIELVAAKDDRTPWIAPDVGADMAIRGVHGVTMTIASPARTLAFMTSVLGFEIVEAAGERTRLAVGGHAPGHFIDVVADPHASPSMNGLGTVHHVAMAVATDADQLAVRAELVRLGVGVTAVLDRQYFHSIYFREPGGVLFEIATMAPGFAVDEPVGALGLALKLPPWEEPNRADIERGLAPVTPPR